MTKLEQNNINAQVSLMNDIIRNYSGITYSVATKGKDLVDLLACKKWNEAEKTFTLDKETFEKISIIASSLQDERRFYKLGTLAESAVPDNEIKMKILKQLQNEI